MSYSSHVDQPDVILIGSGVMSANVGALLKSIEPTLKIQVYEVTAELAQESSDGWNNAGTGHAGICELSYTPFREPDGTVKVQKAIDIFAQFEWTKQFWAYALKHGMVDQPREFINPVPHLSFVHGAEQVEYLRARYNGLKAHHFFSSMEFSTDRAQIGQWAPLLVEERGEVPIAATRMTTGTDVNFGAISRKLLHWLSQQPGCGVASNHRVIDLKRVNGKWEVTVKNLLNGEIRQNHAKFIFVGAGGGSLPLLQKAGIAESKGLGGFPIGGQWLVCENPEIVQRHEAKVYGQALEAAPTMAVPHLDTRILNGKKTLLFGPFASWTTKFLHKKGSYLDLPLSVKPDNLLTLIKIGLSNFSLVRYLVQQGTQSMADRMKVLHIFYPGAKTQDWKLIDGGIRVQAIKKTDGEAGIVHYGTEVITSADRSISALLGASPGASVCVHVAMEVIRKSFPELMQNPDCQARLKAMIPVHDLDAQAPQNAETFRQAQAAANEVLGLN